MKALRAIKLGLLIALFAGSAAGFGWLGQTVFSSLVGGVCEYADAEVGSRPFLRALMKAEWSAYRKSSDPGKLAEIERRLAATQAKLLSTPKTFLERYIIAEEYFWPGLLGLALAGFFAARVRWPQEAAPGAHKQKRSALPPWRTYRLTPLEKHGWGEDGRYHRH